MRYKVNKTMEIIGKQNIDKLGDNWLIDAVNVLDAHKAPLTSENMLIARDLLLLGMVYGSNKSRA